MNVAWAMLWGGSRRTKPCVFPCKVAAGDDERYLVCATVAAGGVLCTNRSSYVFCKNACSCVRSSMRFFKLCLQIALEWLHECCVGYVAGRKRAAGARNLVFFRVKWLQATMKGTSCVRRLRLGSFCARIVPPMCFATTGCSCVRSSMRFLNLWLQIALEWLHECCVGYVVGRKPAHETLCFSV